MAFIKRLLGCLLTASMFIACSSSSTPIVDSIKAQSRLLSFPAAYYENVVYISNKLIAFSHDPSKPPSERISFVYEGEANLHLFQPEPDPLCTSQTVYNVMGGVLPDGRLGLLKDCWTDAPTATRSIFAYDLQNDLLEQIVNGPIAKGLLPKLFTWNPEMTKGIQEMGNGLEGTIYWISPAGASPMDIEIEDQGLKWNLKDYFEGKERVGSASDPAWSPDGNTIAFFASAYGIREEPLPKMNLRHEMYLMNVSDLKPIQVVPNIANAFRLQWSLDSKRLLFSGCMGLQLQCALWLYDIDRKSLALIDKGDFEDFTWINNEKIVASKNITLPFKNNEIWEYSFQN